MKRKGLFVTIVVIFSFLVFLATFVVIWFWGDTYSDMTDFKTGVEIPGLKENAVPQGIANYYDGSSKQEYFFISAYMKKGPSRLYVTAANTGYVGYVTMKYLDPENDSADENGYVDYYGHGGGVATNCKSGEKNGTLWLTLDNTKDPDKSEILCAKRSSTDYTNIAEEVIKRAALEDGENVIKFDASFKANCRASFLYFYKDANYTTNDRLYVGEFYRKGNYETAETHHVTTKNGIAQRAFVYEYQTSTSSDNKYGLTTISDTSVPTESRVPKIRCIYSIPDKIQGFARTASGDLVLSQSYGLPNSHLYYYKWNEVYTSTIANKALFNTLGKKINFEYDGVFKNSGVKYTDSSLYVYFIDESKLIRDYSISSMSEGLCASGDRIYVLFESGSYKYRPFVRRRIENVQYFVPRSKSSN